MNGKQVVIPDSNPESEVGEMVNADVGQILNIPDHFEYAPSTLQNDTKGMARLVYYH